MKHILVVIFSLIAYLGYSQNTGKLAFIEHLINRGDFDEVIYLIEKDSLEWENIENDSVNYFKGWAHYSLKNLIESTNSFMKVPQSSPFYLKSHFFAGYNQIHLGNYPQAKAIFNELTLNDGIFKSLANFELTGVEMLQRNLDASKTQILTIDPNIAAMNQQIIALKQIIVNQESHRRKSPVLAGIMSGIVPGSGKIYAGKTGQGIASFIATTGFGLITWENYRKLGIENAKTLFFGSIFAANYVSTIYGSIVSVKIIENEYQDAIHNQILFQLHIPLRNIFEQ